MSIRKRLHLTYPMKTSCQADLVLRGIVNSRAHGPAGRRQHPSPDLCGTNLGPLNLENRTLKNSTENLAPGKRADTKPHSLTSFMPESFTSNLMASFICLVWKPQKNFFESEMGNHQIQGLGLRLIVFPVSPNPSSKVQELKSKSPGHGTRSCFSGPHTRHLQDKVGEYFVRSVWDWKLKWQGPIRFTQTAFMPELGKTDADAWVRREEWSPWQTKELYSCPPRWILICDHLYPEGSIEGLMERSKVLGP